MFICRLGISTCFFTILLLSSCSMNGPDTSVPRKWSGSEFWQAIGLSSDRHEQNKILHQYSVNIDTKIGDCMQEKGFTYIFDSSENPPDFGFSLSREQFAKEFGFGMARGAVIFEELTHKNERLQNRKQEYLDSLTDEELQRYTVALEGTIPAGTSENNSTGYTGCRSEVHSFIEDAPWITNAEWLNEVTLELERHIEDDHHIIGFNRQWFECMSKMGYVEWSSERNLADSLSDEFIKILQQVSSPDTSIDFFRSLTDLDDRSTIIYRKFAEREIELATISYQCVMEYEHLENEYYRKLENSILNSNPPPNI